MFLKTFMLLIFMVSERAWFSVKRPYLENLSTVKTLRIFDVAWRGARDVAYSS